MRAYTRQFVVGPHAVSPGSDWLTESIPGIGVLSHSPELRVQRVMDRDGRLWHLLGIAVPSDATSDLDPARAIAAASTESVVARAGTWAGRWILIGAGRLHMDAGGLLGCYYRIRERRGAGLDVWASSAAGLLVDESERGAMRHAGRRLRHEVGMDWHPPPGSRFPMIRSLLPSQILSLATGEPIPRWLVPLVDPRLGYDDALAMMEMLLVTALRRVAARARALYLPLTAGWDSRLVLAAAHRAGIDFETFTLLHRGVARGDRVLPPLLAAAVGARHWCVAELGYNRHIADLCEEHSAGHAVGADVTHLVHGLYDWCREGDVLLRGGMLELGREYYWKKFAASNPPWVVPGSRVILRGFRQPGDLLLHATIEAWSAWAIDTPHQELDWRDRLYLEQRIGGWLSAIEQLLDLTATERFYAVNSQLALAHLLHLARVRHRNGGTEPSHFRELIRRMAPALADFPVNPPEPRYRELGKKVRRATLRTVGRVRGALRMR